MAMNERRSTDDSRDHAGEKYPWTLPECGVHITTLRAEDVAAALDVSREVAEKVTELHGESVTSFDFVTLHAGCGCGWSADERRRVEDGFAAEEAARDLLGHLSLAASSVAWTGKATA